MPSGNFEDKGAVVQTNLDRIYREYREAISKFPPFHSAHEGYAILLEEVDELWDEIKGNKKPGAYGRMKKEAIQVGAMALRFLVMLDETNADEVD
jgi:NTP pyrophosphatase (non-canonical NTP hydrolase)